MKVLRNMARPEWQKKAAEMGFTFHTMHDEPYWDESFVYSLTMDEIEGDIEWAGNQLHEMSMEAAAEIVASDDLMRRMAIPESAFDLLRRSWSEDRDCHLYGRFDLCHDGEGPVKLYEYNADTPTSLYEAAVFQWKWLEDQIEAGNLPSDADQFNGLWEALVARWPSVVRPGEMDIHFAGDFTNPEDVAILRVLTETAAEAGYATHDVNITEIGYSDEDRRFLDAEDRIIGNMFKLYPWEDMLRDEFSALIPGSRTRFVEPAWKAVLSNKGLMAVLWRMFEGHPNLLPCLFEDEMRRGGAFELRTREAIEAAGSARKPLLSREGANITLTSPTGRIEESRAGGYGHHPHVIQALHRLPVINGRRPVIGAWVVGDRCVGMGIRDDRDMITGDLSRFRPHVIEG